MLDWLRRRSGEPALAVTPELWRRATAPWLFMRGLPAPDNERLRALCEAFLAGKHFSGTHDLEITPLMKVHVAAQACILVLELGIEWYEGWSEIIVYPSQFAPEREVMDEDGVVHLTNDPMAGEAWLGGPVVLSYEDVAMTADEETRVAGYNVVIHEFAHKLDMRSGEANGCPPLPPEMAPNVWKKTLTTAFDHFGERIEGGDRTAIDPYAGETPAEFFAVLTEVFFAEPALLRHEYRDVYALFVKFYRQDPAARAELLLEG
jgi:MtfA peptidase